MGALGSKKEGSHSDLLTSVNRQSKQGASKREISKSRDMKHEMSGSSIGSRKSQVAHHHVEEKLTHQTLNKDSDDENGEELEERDSFADVEDPI